MTADKHLSVDVLQNKCSWKFRNTHSKTPALESFLKILLNIYYKETPAQVFYCDYCEIFKNVFFTEHPS